MEGNLRYLRQMNYMKDLTSGLPDKSMALQVRMDGRVTLCAGAVRLLGLTEGRVRFKVDNGHVYVGKSTDPNFGYVFRKHGREARISNKKLARALADALNGYGDYLVEQENSVLVYPGIECYSIFHKNYKD